MRNTGKFCGVLGKLERSKQPMRCSVNSTYKADMYVTLSSAAQHSKNTKTFLSLPVVEN